jgi:large subunit ribosomal protein L31
MKKAIHPSYYQDAKITCACGSVLAVGSTVKEIHVEICASCHPFYTGKQKIIDTAGKVDRFIARQLKTKQLQKKRKKKKSS